MSEPKLLGVMKPMGGGDPIPLKKPDLVIGRRPSCDIRLDFENVSGKHCALKFINGTWHIRDLGSTNGTTVNGQKISNQHGVLPDDELGVASHLFSIDYEPANPAMESQQILEEEMASERTRKPKSLMELAGLESDSRPSQREPARPTPRPRPDDFPPAAPARQDFHDAIPEDFPASTPSRPPDPDDDDFFKLIEEDVKKRADKDK
ncbi:hypothetical protein BH23PLA1_BH23PLA1_13300 [soil metagenome]